MRKYHALARGIRQLRPEGGHDVGVELRDASQGGDVTLVNVTIIATAPPAKGIRCELSPGEIQGPGNQYADPRFVDAAGGDFRPLASSPTVDAGSTDELLGAYDPAGCTRALGAAPDIGAFEYQRARSSSRSTSRPGSRWARSSMRVRATRSS